MPKKPKKKPKKKIVKNYKKEFDVELTLLENRQLFLFGGIDDRVASKIIKELYALDAISNSPITMYINSPGGSCNDGLAIIDTMKTVRSPIVTIVSNEVCSMGGQISVVGDHRACYVNSVWMAHDMYACLEDYSLKIQYRAKFLENYYQILENNLIMHTKLTAKQLVKARSGELWLFANDMLEFGIVDEIMTQKP